MFDFKNIPNIDFPIFKGDLYLYWFYMDIDIVIDEIKENYSERKRIIELFSNFNCNSETYICKSNNNEGKVLLLISLKS